ncbi:MAG: hypothetical protein ACW98D_20515 [Promethearchaeota archaeon]
MTRKSPYYQLVYKVLGRRTSVSTKTKNLKEAKQFLATFTPPDRNEKLKLNSSISLSEFRNEYINYCSLSKSSNYIERSIEPSLELS